MQRTGGTRTYGSMRRPFRWMLGAMLLVTAAVTSCAHVRGNLECDSATIDPCGAPLPASSAAEWRKHVASGRALVFRGRFLSRVRSSGRTSDEWTVRCAVTDVYAGAADSAVVAFGSPIAFAPDCLVPGDPVLVLVSRSGASNPVPFSGGYYRIDRDSRILSYFRNDCDRHDFEREGRALRVRDLRLRVMR